MSAVKEVPTGYKQTEIGVIPEDWQVYTLGQIGDVLMCKRIFNHQTQKNGAVPFYKIGTFGKEADAFISSELFQSFKKRFSYPRKGEILISASGTLGRTIVFDGKPSYFQDSNIVWIENNQLNVKNAFLFFVLNEIKYESEGSTIQRLYNSIIKRAKFPLPPLPEQKAIAKVLSDTDSLIESLDQLIAKKKAIKQGAMQELLTGKRRLPGFAKSTGYKQTELGVIPEDWEVKRLGEVISIGHGKDQKGIESQNGKYPILASGGEIGRTNISLYSGPSALIGRKGTIDKPQYSEGPFWTIDTLFFSIPISACNMRYVFYLFQRIEWRSFNEASGVPSLSSATIQNILCLFPKIAEQSAIVITLDKMEKEIQSLESKRDKYTQIKQGMMEQLLTGKVRLVG